MKQFNMVLYQTNALIDSMLEVLYSVIVFIDIPNNSRSIARQSSVSIN